MAWDDTKNTGDELTSTEWNNHVSDQKSPVLEQRGDPGTGDLDAGEIMVYNSDGTGTGSAGDLVYAVNDSGTIKTAILQQKSNAS